MAAQRCEAEAPRRTQHSRCVRVLASRHSSGESMPPRSDTCDVICNGAALELRLVEQACGCSTVRGGGGLNNQGKFSPADVFLRPNYVLLVFKFMHQRRSKLRVAAAMHCEVAS